MGEELTVAKPNGLKFKVIRGLKKAGGPITAEDLATKIKRPTTSVRNSLGALYRSPGNKGFISAEREGRLNVYTMTDKGKEKSSQELAKLLPIVSGGDQVRTKPVKRKVTTTPREKVPVEKFTEDFQIEPVPEGKLTIEINPSSMNKLRIEGQGADEVVIKLID